MPVFSAYILNANTLSALIATLAVMVGGAVFGSFIGEEKGSATDTIVGVGLAGGLLAIWGVAGQPISQGSSTLGLVAVVMAALAMQRRHQPGGALPKVLILLSPLLLIAAGATATMWDDFYHWLPNAAYVFRYDHLPASGLPPSLSKWPGYPHTLPFIVAEASRMVGRFLESAGPIANVAFLAAFGAMLAEVVTDRQENGRWTAAGLGAAFATFLNPAFDHNVVFASYSDVATAVTMAACGFLGVGVLEAIEEERNDAANLRSWRFALAATALINLKQANAVLLALLLTGLGLLAARAGRKALWGALRRLPVLLAAPAAVFLIWRIHVIANTVGGEMSFRAVSTWNFDVFGRTLGQIGGMMAHAPLFFALIYGATVLGLAAMKRPNTPARRLAVVTAVVWIGYNAFLALVYLGAMTPEEASNAADYWRYAPHVGLLALAAVVSWAAEVLRKRFDMRKAWPIALAVPLVLMPLAAWLSPANKLWPMHYRQVGQEAYALLPDGATVVILGGYHLDPFGTAMLFDLSGQEQPKDRHTRGLLHPGELPDVIADVRAGKITHALITDYFWTPEKEQQIVGLPPLVGETALFAWNGTGWTLMKSWPTPKRTE